MPDILPPEEVMRLMDSLQDPNIQIDISTYRGMKQKCRFIDKDYGEWWEKPSCVIRIGYRNPKRGRVNRGRKSRLSIGEIVSRLKEIHGDQVIIDEDTYIASNQRATFIDRDYGPFEALVQCVIRGEGHRKRSYVERGEKRKCSKEQIDAKIFSAHGDVVRLDHSTYIGSSVPARFIHKIYGEWWTNPSHVFRGVSHPAGRIDRIRETFRKKYGVEHALQHEAFFKKGAKTQRFRLILPHWKTGEPVICMASYEFAVISKLNEMKIDYQSQVKFRLSKSVYYCDLYIPAWDKYIEIKGYMRPPSKVKWDEFHATHPNSELWTLDKVVQFTGKTLHHLGKDFKLAKEAILSSSSTSTQSSGAPQSG